MKHSIRSVVRRSSLTFAALAFSLGVLTLSTQPVLSVHAAPAPTITATIHDNWAGITAVPPNLRYEFLRHPHYSLHVTGANFTPGASVRLALLRVDTLQVLQRGSTSAEGTSIWVPEVRRSVPNPRAGTFDYSAAVGMAAQTPLLRFLSRSENHVSIDTVTSR